MASEQARKRIDATSLHPAQNWPPRRRARCAARPLRNADHDQPLRLLLLRRVRADHGGPAPERLDLLASSILPAPPLQLRAVSRPGRSRVRDVRHRIPGVSRHGGSALLREAVEEVGRPKLVVREASASAVLVPCRRWVRLARGLAAVSHPSPLRIDALRLWDPRSRRRAAHGGSLRRRLPELSRPHMDVLAWGARREADAVHLRALCDS